MNSYNLFEQIERIGALIRAEERKKCKELGLQAIHVQILHYLSICNKYSNTPAAISNYIGITRGPISQTVIYMAQKGLIEKNSGISDKRVVHLRITPHGKDIFAQLKPTAIFSQASLILEKNGFHSPEPFIQVLVALQKANNSRTFGICKTCKYFQKTTKGNICGLTTEKLSEDDSKKICNEHMY